MSLFLDAFVTSILYAAFFSIAALGLNLVFGVMRIVNLAHGEFLVMGSYLAIALADSYGFNPVVSLAVVVPVFLAIGLLLYFPLVPRLQKSGDPEMSSFILFFGVSYAMEGLAVQLFGVSYQSLQYNLFKPVHVEILGSTIPTAWVVTAAVSVAALILVYFYLYRTGLGLQTRALMINRDEAMANGVNINAVSAIAFGFSIALAASAGVFSSFISFPTSPSIGDTFTLVSFAIIIIGALGNPLATVVGAVVFAFAYGYTEIYAANWSSIVPFIILIAVILARPQGLLGRKAREF
jgi:branched-chain amino acid transport system permease protein